MFAYLPLSLALFAILPSLVSAKFPPSESYAACLDAAPGNLAVLVSAADAGGIGNCSPYCNGLRYRFAYVTPGSTQCGCSNVGPTAAQFSTADDAFMTCRADQYDARIALTSFSIPTCYSGYTATSLPALRVTSTVNDVSQCFTNCINYEAASVVPALDGSSYQCTCDQNAGDVDGSNQVTCAKGTLVRYADHSPGQNADGVATPGPSTYVKRQIREQLRLDSQKEQSLCPDEGRACLVGRGKESWECVDVKAELESCGGCMNGEFGVLSGASPVGVDCTALPGVSMGGVTCTHGQCAVWACDPGFKLVDRECVEVKSVKALGRRA